MDNLPKYRSFDLPTLRAVQELGGSGSIGEIDEAVERLMGFDERQQAILHNGGPRSEASYRTAWARSELKALGLLANSDRGVWSITDIGEQLLRTGKSETELDAELRKQVANKNRQRRSDRSNGETEFEAILPSTDLAEDVTDEVDEEFNWKGRLIAFLTSKEFTPDQFERLAKRLLREADFQSVEVTGRSGDQGIDGVGKYRLGLLTFPVFFQCKNYKGSVGPGDIRDFRGAMQGRGEKGIFLTTGTFTRSARQEASRDGATPIDLIDGEQLCELLLQYKLGLHTVEEVKIDKGYFLDI